MQIDQTYGVSQYRAVMQTAQTAAPAETAAEETTATQTTESAASTDRVELSADASVAKMSAEDRAALVKSLKADQENQMNRFVNMMTQMFQTQGITAATAGDNNFWKMIASGNYKVDAETKAAAQEAISENGYWGVNQTSQRIFDMASALAGDDPEKMRAMQAAVEKGFKQAGIAWGGELPSITGDTHEAINKMFDDYYAKYDKSSEEEQAPAETEKAESDS